MNAYEGADIWKDLILRQLPVDRNEEIGGDTIWLLDGGVIGYREETGLWVA